MDLSWYFKEIIDQNGLLYGYNFVIKDILFGDEIEQFESEVLSIANSTKENMNVNLFQFDTSQARDFFFKHSRLFPFCNQIKEENENITCKMLLNEWQRDTFPNLEEILEGIQIETVEGQYDIDQKYKTDDFEFTDFERYYKLENDSIELFKQWLEDHPAKDEPLIFIGDKSLSAQQLYNEISDGTSLGKRYRDSIIEIGLKFGLLNLSVKA